MMLNGNYPFMAALETEGRGGEKRRWHPARLKAFDGTASSPRLHPTMYQRLFPLYDGCVDVSTIVYQVMQNIESVMKKEAGSGFLREKRRA
jgi:hypothetical protein